MSGKALEGFFEEIKMPTADQSNVLTATPCTELACQVGVIVERGCAVKDCDKLEEFHAEDSPVAVFHAFEWDGIDEKPYDCPVCRPPKHTSEGLTYVAVGAGGSGAVVLGSECTILLQMINEEGPDPESVGLDSPPDEGIWKTVVRFFSSKSYHGDYDSGFNIGDWEEVEVYPEPYCDLHQENNGPGGCKGMLRTRGVGDEWACDEHAGQVA
ncbi:hypothetical protein LCGC14_1274840 [marine sediment metagenome]|uniref:Uncharacterized protein n=1 Tax=marine sediment metagenome TaxID=412755 RepID=A0A0F9KYQ5_9ZZZZ